MAAPRACVETAGFREISTICEKAWVGGSMLSPRLMGKQPKRESEPEHTSSTCTSLIRSCLDVRTKNVHSWWFALPGFLSSLCLLPMRIMTPSTPSCPTRVPLSSSSSTRLAAYVTGYCLSSWAANDASGAAVVCVLHMGQLASRSYVGS